MWSYKVGRIYTDINYRNLTPLCIRLICELIGRCFFSYWTKSSIFEKFISLHAQNRYFIISKWQTSKFYISIPRTQKMELVFPKWFLWPVYSQGYSWYTIPFLASMLFLNPNKIKNHVFEIHSDGQVIRHWFWYYITDIDLDRYHIRRKIHTFRLLCANRITHW